MFSREAKWFYVSVTNYNINVESGHNQLNKSWIKMPRTLQKTKLEAILDLYHRRKRGESVSGGTTQLTQNQVYWYGIFAEMNL